MKKDKPVKAGTVNVHGAPYKITIETSVGKDGDRMGECCYSERFIRIHSGLIRDHSISTLGHEIGHCVLSEGGALSALSGDQQEIACNIAGKVAEIMFNNLALVGKVVKMSADIK